MPADFHFIRPEWLLALPLIAVLALGLARRQLAPGNWQRVVDPVLAPFVLSRAPGRGLDYRWVLVLLCGTLAVLALAGPSWQRIEQPVYRSAQALVLAIDLSRSMDAEDVTPSRLARARLKVLDILERRKTGLTALLVYSGDAFTVTPLTSDTDTIAALVASLSTDIMPSQGSNPVTAIDKGRQLLEQGGVHEGEILLVTDGGASTAAEQAASELHTDGYRLSVLGVGTLAGAPIPQAGGGFVTDRRGDIVVPRLEDSGLRALAKAGGGRYATMTTDDRDVDALLSAEFDAEAQTGGDLATDQWREEGPWLLLLLVPLAALAFRRGWILTVLVFLLPLPTPAHAFGWSDLWQTGDQQARRQLAAGNAAEAAALFDDPRWQGVAHYRAGDYAGSANAFAGQEDASGLYNFGNALARQGKFQAAIDAYTHVLDLDPDDEDAAHNRKLLQRMLKNKQSQSGGQGNKSSSSDGGQSPDDGQSAGEGQQAQQAGQKSNAAGGGDNSQMGDSNAQNDKDSKEDMEAMRRELEQAARQAEQREAGKDGGKAPLSPAEVAAERHAQEQQQALEQWLRRIPDDPGGLLRRKFLYQYQRQGVDQDGNSLQGGTGTDPW